MSCRVLSYRVSCRVLSYRVTLLDLVRARWSAGGVWKSRGISIPIDSTPPVALYPNDHSAYHWPVTVARECAICIRPQGYNWSGAIGVGLETESAVRLRPATGAAADAVVVSSAHVACCRCGICVCAAS